MNPIDLSGPQFLLFYLAAGALTLSLIRYLWKIQESGSTKRPPLLTDPYEIAFLRGGKAETLRIAIFSLADRGLLQFSGDHLQVKNDAAIAHARRPIEKAILTKFRIPSPAHTAEGDPSLQSACGEYHASLTRNRLVAGEAVYASRMPLLAVGVLVLGGLAAAKVLVALQRGRTNIAFLVLLAGLGLYLLFKVQRARRTGLGDRMLEDLQNLLKGLRARSAQIKTGGETNEAALLAAVFGLPALPAAYSSIVDKIFPRPRKGDGSISGDLLEVLSDLSDSSCGSSCGGGCGGGGCGGCGS
jgi:uncharacterized protein (TIGR04222 family)